MIEIKPYSARFEQAHIDFAQKYWTKRRRFTPNYIYWKFRKAENVDLKSFVLAVDNDKVIGQFGLIPCEIKTEGKVISAQWACDLMVDKEYRGKGVAELLYDYAHKNQILTLGSDPSPSAEKSMFKKGYRLLYGPRKFVFPVRINEIGKLKGIDIKLLNFLNPFLLLFRILNNNKVSEISPSLYFEIMGNLNNDYVEGNYNKAFQDWRFQSFDSFYQGIKCYQLGEKSYFSGYFSGGVYVITDFKVPSFFSFFKIINFIYSQHTNNLLRIKFLCFNSLMSFCLPFFGFLPFRTITKIVFFTENTNILNLLREKKFKYRLFDSDENI